MASVIKRPIDISADILKKIVALVNEGDQVNITIDDIKRSEFIGYIEKNGEIASTVTLKNPRNTYRSRVFLESNSNDKAEDFDKELGYIVTSAKYEGEKLCQKLLSDVTSKLEQENYFATTRNPRMAHILSKFGFKKSGDTYKGNLELHIRKVKS